MWLNSNRISSTYFRVYFELVCLLVEYQAFTYLKSHNKLYRDISIAEDPPSEKMFMFSDIVEIQGETKSDTEKNISELFWKAKEGKYKQC